jgi:hypothetical protein
MGGRQDNPSATARLLASAERHPGCLSLLCTDHDVYLARQYHLQVRQGGGLPDALLAALPVHWTRAQAARLRYVRRLGRLWVRELIQIDQDHLLAVVQRRLIRLHRASGEMEEVFRVRDGGRPKGLAVTPQGWIFSGEYWDNPRRRPLRIWGSADGGRSWELMHTLSAGRAKHIHNLVWDEYRQGMWVLTGDGDGECAFLFTPDLFHTVTEVGRGGQQWRAVHCFCRPEGLYYSTDTERDQNWLIFLDTASLHSRKIRPMPGSCIYATRMAGRYFLSTSVEPSTINHYPNAVLWSSPDLENWEKVLEMEKDWLPGEYFGFGSIMLPRVQGGCDKLVFSAIAVRKYDFMTFVVEPDVLDGDLSA